MTKGLIGKKIGMTQIFDEAGKVVPVTVIEAGPCVVTQLKTAENDGYEAVQLGFGDVSPKHTNKPMTGHFKKNDLPFKRTLKEFRLDDISNVNVGDVLKADVFAAGDVIDVSGVSKGKGYQASQPAQTEGNSRYRSCCKTGRFYGRLLISLENIQGQGHGRSHGC